MHKLESVEYQMLRDMDEYNLPETPIEYENDNTNNYELEQMFAKESHEYNDIQKFHKVGRTMTKAEMRPEQCRST